MFGVSIGPPYDAIAEKPTSSSTAYTTFGAPSGAFGGSNGDQSGTESRMAMLISPLNVSLILGALLFLCNAGGARPPGSRFGETFTVHHGAPHHLIGVNAS